MLELALIGDGGVIAAYQIPEFRTPEGARMIISAYALTLGYPEYCDEYYADVESIEGPGYWESFETEEDLIEDFRMWLENVT